jgi:tetratricopeptide (TPR) repeat protein
MATIKMAVSGIVLVIALIGNADTAIAANPVIDEAERLDAIGAWYEAITEYERFTFFNSDSPSVAVIRAIADLYGKQGNFRKAAETLDRALSLSLDDSLRDEIRIVAAAFNIAAGDYQTAQLELIRIGAFALSPEIRERANRYLSLVYSMSMDWTGLKKMIDTSTVFEGTRRVLIDSLIANNNARYRVSPVAALWMSTFLPGLGQMYACDVRNGCNALAISFATGYLTVHSVMNGYFQEAILTDVTLFWRYYSGNRWRAMESAERYNKRWDLELRKKILTLIAGQ